MDHLLFSQRDIIANNAERWCYDHRVTAMIPSNIVTALDDLKLLDRDRCREFLKLLQALRECEQMTKDNT